MLFNTAILLCSLAAVQSLSIAPPFPDEYLPPISPVKRCPGLYKPAPIICPAFVIDECQFSIECGRNEICCNNGCQNVCRSKYPVKPVDPPIKQCPNQLTAYTCLEHVISRHECSHSLQCPPGEYCCKQGCRNICQKKTPICPQCDPCSGATCDKHRNARCVAKKCSCSISHFELYGRRYSVSECKVQKPPMKKCPPPLPLQRCYVGMEEECSFTRRCPLGQYCCNDGCVNVCRPREVPMPKCSSASKYSCHKRNQCDKYRPCKPGYKCCNDGCNNVCEFDEDPQCKKMALQVSSSISSSSQCAARPCQDNNDCPQGNICCDRQPCGKICVQNPMFKRCPGPALGRPCTSTMANECGVNQRCPGGMFCCNDGCVNRCHIKTDKMPACPTQRSCNVPFYNKCSKLYTCRDGYSCCHDGCANVCQKDVCPGGKPKMHCKVNPCDVSKCPRYRDAVCVPNYCGGCNAEWFLDGVKMTDKQCNQPTCKASCPSDSCKGYKCLGYGNRYECFPDTCHGCKPMFYDLKGNSIQCKKVCKPVKCLVDPCSVSSCPSRSHATCQSDYCGGCNAIWSENGVELTDRQCHKPLCERICGRQKCEGHVCKGHGDDIQCDPDTCNNCEPLFYDGSGKKIQCDKVCPNGVPLVKCAKNPCDGAKCGVYTNAKCRANYCGGCNAEFYVDGKRVNCGSDPCPYNDLSTVRCPASPVYPSTYPTSLSSCVRNSDCNYGEACCRQGCFKSCRKPLPPQQFCPPNMPQARCMGHPCADKKCYGYPRAECRANYCGGCNAEWYVDNRRIKCRSSPDKPGKCPIPPPNVITPCVVHCMNDAECLGNKKCCSYGCTRQCSSPTY